MEIRLQIWSLCVPGPRVYEMGIVARQEDHNTFPYQVSLYPERTGTPPVISYVCSEARQTVLRAQHYATDKDSTLPIPLRRGIDIVHLNWHSGYDNHDYLPDIPNPLPSFQRLVSHAGVGSVSAELLHAFNFAPWGQVHSGPGSIAYEADSYFRTFCSNRRYHVVLAMVEIHLSNHDAAARTHVFGALGEQPCRLVDPGDTATLVKFRDAWRICQPSVEPELDQFFSTVIESAEEFATSVKEWLRQLEMVWVWHRCKVENVAQKDRMEIWPGQDWHFDPTSSIEFPLGHPPPLIRYGTNPWATRSLNREHPWVQEQIQKRPLFTPALMFRHCNAMCGSSAWRSARMPVRGGSVRGGSVRRGGMGR